MARKWKISTANNSCLAKVPAATLLRAQSIYSMPVSPRVWPHTAGHVAFHRALLSGPSVYIAAFCFDMSNMYKPIMGKLES